MSARVAAVALALAACADPEPTGEPDAGTDDASGTDAPAACVAPTALAPGLTAYLDATIATLAGAADIAPGTRLTARATSAQRATAREFLRAELVRLGLVATVEDYGSGANVVAELAATTTATAPLVVVGAHFDTVPGSPGADDNATGTAAVLALVQQLGALSCRDHAVRFVLFDQEEIGLVGSTYHARQLRLSGRAVTAVHTLDQLGWDRDGDRRFEIELPTPALFAEYQAAATTLGLAVEETTSSGTDHEAFRERGFAAVGVSEEFVGGDTTPHYHAPTDTAATIDGPTVARATLLVAHVLARELGAP